MELLYFLFLLIIQDAYSQANPNTYIKKLLDGYDRLVSPYYFTKQKLEITATYPWIILNQLEEDISIASWSLAITLIWKDPRLKFDPVDYDGNQVLFVPVSELWLPRFTIYNSVETRHLLDGPDEDAKIESDGTATTTFSMFARTNCKIRSTRMPFDTQCCGLELSNPVMNSSFYSFRLVDHPGADYIGGAQFKILNVSPHYINYSVYHDNMTDAIMFITFARHTIYFSIVVVIPTLLITALTITGMLLPIAHHTGGDLIQVGMASMLAHSITLTVVADTMPRSAYLPVLGTFVIECLAICALSAILGLILSHFLRSSSKSGKLPKVFFILTCMQADEKTEKQANEKENFQRCKEAINRLYIESFCLLMLILLTITIIYYSYSWDRPGADPSLFTLYT